MITGQRVKGYNQAMELLCCLSPLPVRVRTLASDFQMASPSAVRASLRTLERDRGLRVTFGQQMKEEPGNYLPDPTGGWVWVEPEDWRLVEGACLDYWQSVYDGQMAA